MKNFVMPGKTITLTAPGPGVTSGQPVLIGSLFGVCAFSAATGAPVEVTCEGVFDLAKAAVVIDEAAAVYWDAGASKVTNVGGGNKLVGACVSAAGLGDATARVRLNGVAIT